MQDFATTNLAFNRNQATWAGNCLPTKKVALYNAILLVEFMLN
jgi:hypothetical protein